MSSQLRILDFALMSLWRRKGRHSLTLVVYGGVVFLLGSVLMMARALEHEASVLLSGAPELVVQKLSAGRHDWIPIARGQQIEGIRGVKSVSARFWGYYFDPPPGVTYTFMGIDELPLQGTQLADGRGYSGCDELSCVVGKGVADARLMEADDLFPVKGADGQLYALRVTDTFTGASSLLTHDVVLLRAETWRRVFDVPPGVATDLVVTVPNPNEVSTVMLKILEKLPDVRVIDRESMLKTYEAAFGWRGSLVVLAFAGALAAFAILAFDRAAGLSADERRDLGVLKGIGWSVSDVIKLKVWEGVIISFTAFLAGILAAHVHVFHFGAGALVPFLRGWSALFPDFQLKPHGELFQIATVFMLTVLPYIGLMLVPAWTAAITDPDRVMRG